MAEVQHLLEFQWTTFYHAQTSQSRRLEVFIFRRRGCGGSFPSSLTVLTSSNNASLKISVRQNSPCKWKLLIACEEYIRLKWKENKLIILKFDFFFSATVAGTNYLQIIHVTDNVLVFYFENDDGQKITKITEGCGTYYSLPNTTQMCSYDQYFYRKERDTHITSIRASLVAQMGKNPPVMRETWVWSLGWEDPLEEGMAMHSSILAWRIPGTERPGGLYTMESQRVGHNWATQPNIFYEAHGNRCVFTRRIQTSCDVSQGYRKSAC